MNNLELTDKMHNAVLQNDVDAVSWVIGQAPEILSRRDTAGRNWFHIAAINESVEVIDWLASHGEAVDINGCETLGRTPLWVVSGETPRTEVYKALLRAGADSNALYNGNGLLRRIMEDGRDRSGVEIVQCLLEHCADPNLIDSVGHTPLHFAVDRYRPKYVKVLLAAGADPTILNQDGEDVIDLAKRKMPEMVDQLQAWVHAKKAHKSVVDIIGASSENLPASL